MKPTCLKKTQKIMKMSFLPPITTFGGKLQQESRKLSHWIPVYTGIDMSYWLTNKHENMSFSGLTRESRRTGFPDQVGE
jgi:hypothetical protein